MKSEITTLEKLQSSMMPLQGLLESEHVRHTFIDYRCTANHYSFILGLRSVRGLTPPRPYSRTRDGWRTL